MYGADFPALARAHDATLDATADMDGAPNKGLPDRLSRAKRADVPAREDARVLSNENGADPPDGDGSRREPERRDRAGLASVPSVVRAVRTVTRRSRTSPA